MKVKPPQSKRPYHVNYLEGFWLAYVRDIFKKVKKAVYGNVGSFIFKRRSFTPKWEYIVIAFLLGLLMMSHSSGHVLRLSEPAPAPIQLKPLPKLKDVSYAPQTAVELVWVSKLRPPDTYPNGYAPGNCTAGVASRLPIPNDWGNANNWAYAASMAGYTVTNVPTVESIAQTAGDSWAGHVALVLSVNPDGSFVIWEENYAGLYSTDTRTTTTAEFPNFIKI